MNGTSGKGKEDGQPRRHGVESRTAAARFAEAWSFVYVFFSNGTPFDAPNRSEPCPQS
jgi:hypothetical protein